jgi:hypothetical protein
VVLCIPYITSEDVSAHMPFVSGTLPALLSIAPSIPTLMVSASRVRCSCTIIILPAVMTLGITMWELDMPTQGCHIFMWQSYDSSKQLGVLFGWDTLIPVRD